jgi:hypothetical protein
MLPDVLLPESMARADGQGLAIDLRFKRGKLLVLTLGITTVLEQGGLDVSVWGSSNGENWGSKALATYPSKSYCGIYSILLNLVSRPGVGFVRVQWKMKQWGRRETTPMFSFYVYAEESGARGCAAAVVA